MPWALDMLADRFGLSGFEQNALLLCAATGTRHPDRESVRPRPGRSPEAFPHVRPRARPVRRPDLGSPRSGPSAALPGGWSKSTSRGQALTASALRADERIVNYLKGLNHLDERLAQFFSPWEFSYRSATLSPTQEKQVDAILQASTQAAAAGPRPVVQLVGADSVSKQLVALHVATKLEPRLYRVNAEMLPSSLAELDTLARLWQRESRAAAARPLLRRRGTGRAPRWSDRARSAVFSPAARASFSSASANSTRGSGAPPGGGHCQARRRRTTDGVGGRARHRGRRGPGAAGGPVQPQSAGASRPSQGRRRPRPRAVRVRLTPTAWDLCRASERPRSTRSPNGWNRR
jgi:hypothetical protein